MEVVERHGRSLCKSAPRVKSGVSRATLFVRVGSWVRFCAPGRAFRMAFGGLSPEMAFGVKRQTADRVFVRVQGRSRPCRENQKRRWRLHSLCRRETLAPPGESPHMDTLCRSLRMRADQAVSCERGQGGPELPPENAGREKPSFSGRQGANIG